MARVLKGSHSFTWTPRVHPLTEWTIPAFAFPAEAVTHLPTPEGWKAELALGGWLVTYWNRCPAPGIEPDTVTHLSTDRVRRRLTSLIKANVLTTTPDHQPSYCRRKLYIAEIGIFDLFGSCFLELDPMTLIYDRDPYIFRRYTGCALSSDRQTDRQTRPKLFTTPLGWNFTAKKTEFCYVR